MTFVPELKGGQKHMMTELKGAKGGTLRRGARFNMYWGTSSEDVDVDFCMYFLQGGILQGNNVLTWDVNRYGRFPARFRDQAAATRGIDNRTGNRTGGGLGSLLTGRARKPDEQGVL